MTAKRTGWILSTAFLLAMTAPGCGTADFVYYPSPGSGGAGPTCQDQCLPIGPSEWIGPSLLWIGKEGEPGDCPVSAPVVGVDVHAELNAPHVCGACQCDPPTGTCTLPTTLTAASSPCAHDNDPGVAHTSFDAPSGWGGLCTAENAIPANQTCNGVDCVQSLTIGPLTIDEAPCGVAANSVAAELSHTWAVTAHSCHGSASGTCAAPGEVCAPAAPPGFAQCLFMKGDQDCPMTYSEKHLFYEDIDDSRSCTPCSCGQPAGSTCTALLSTYKDDACTGLVDSVTIDAMGPKCFDVAPSGQTLGSKQATAPVYAPGVCQPSGGEPVGQAVPTGPATYCCLP